MKDEYEAYLAYCEDHKVPPVSPARYGEVRHFLQTDALRAEVERLNKQLFSAAVSKKWANDAFEKLKTNYDADIAAAVEAAKADEREQVMRELWRRSGHAMFDKRLPSDYRLALQNTFGAWRPTTEQSSAHDPSTNNLTGDGGK